MLDCSELSDVHRHVNELLKDYLLNQWLWLPEQRRRQGQLEQPLPLPHPERMG